MAVKKKSRKGNKIAVDFTGVEAGGRPCPDGTYKAEITSATEEESSSGNPMVVMKLKILNGKGKGAVIYDNLSLLPQALFRLKAVCEAIGLEADSSTEIDLDELVGQELIVDVENETFEDKKRPRAAGYAPAGGKTDEEDSKDADEEEEEEDDPESEEEDEDEDEEEDEKPKKGSSKKVSKPSKKAAKEDDDEEEDEEEDTEEEEDRPTKKAGKKVSTGFVKGAKVKFKDGKTTIRGTITEDIDGDEARVEDRNGDEYDVPIADLELIK